MVSKKQKHTIRRLTIMLLKERQLALKEAATRPHTSMRKFIGQSLIDKARGHSSLNEDEAMALAIEETGVVRR